MNDLREYARDLEGHCRRLSAEEERRQWELARGGDNEARNRLVESVLPWAIRVASRFQRRGIPVEDLVQVANLAVIEAVDGRFDPRLSRLTTFVTRTIGWRLDKECLSNATVVQTPKVRNKRFMKLAKNARAACSLDRSNPANGRPFSEAMVGRDVALEVVDTRDLFRHVRSKLRLLNGQQRTVVDRMLAGQDNLADIAREMDLTRERVRQIQRDAVARLRAAMPRDLIC